MAEIDGIVQEFLVESFENLEQVDRDLVTLESRPDDRELLDRVFRVIHTIKGTCGFLGFELLERVSHAGESLLSRLRDGSRAVDSEVTGGLLALVDALRRILTTIQETGSEGEQEHVDLVAALKRLQDGSAVGEDGGVVAEGPVLAEPTAQASQRPSKWSGRAGSRARAERTKAERTPRPKTKATPARPVSDRISATEGDEAKAAESPAQRRAETASAAPQGSLARAEDEVGQTRDRVLASSVGGAESNVRVDVRVLDRLMDLVGELVLTRNQLLREEDGDQHSGAAALQHLNLVTSELQEGIMKTRMQPVGRIWGKFPRLVRDLAAACGKQVRLEMEGQDTELDRSLIEAIRDPLTHLVRNGIDHGIETPDVRAAVGKAASGRLWLRAFHEGGHVNIEISDDGSGIDPERIRQRAVEKGLVTPEQASQLSAKEALNLIFLPGLSTAEQVTRLSGRGVGMDVVKSNVERVNGLIDIDSVPGQGTTIRLKIPLTLAIIPALVVSTGEEHYAIPQPSILELVRLEGDSAEQHIERVYGAPVYRLRGRLLPLVDLGHELGREASFVPMGGSLTIVVLQADERQFGLVVDAVHDTQEIVVKPLGRILERIPVFAGATIMGDGRVALILDVLGLAQRAHVVAEVREHAFVEAEAAQRQSAEAAAERLLLFRSPDDGRMGLSLDAVTRLERFPAASVERLGGTAVVQYRDDILPLVYVFEQLPERRQQPRSEDGEGRLKLLDVVVYTYSGRQVGLVVGQVIDILEEPVEVRRPSSRIGVRECVVLRGRVTELLDVEGIIRGASLPLLEQTTRGEEG